MSSGPGERAVVVGVDASEAAVGAARFAAAEAVRRSARLHIVHAVTWFDGMTYPYPELDLPALINAGAQSLLQGVADAVESVLPDDRISTTRMTGNRVGGRGEESAAASFLVRGGRGVGGVAGLLGGPPARGVAPRPPCRVVAPPADPGVQVHGRSSVV